MVKKIKFVVDRGLPPPPHPDVKTLQKVISFLALSIMPFHLACLLQKISTKFLNHF